MRFRGSKTSICSRRSIAREETEATTVSPENYNFFPLLALPAEVEEQLTQWVFGCKFTGQGLPFSLGQRLNKSQSVFTANGFDDVVWWCAEQFRDDGELINMVLARKERFALQHLSEDTAGAPDVDLDVVFLPGQHDFRCAVIPGRDVAGHLRILNSRQSKVADLEITVFVHQDVGWFEVTVNHTGRMYIFEAAL